MNDAYNTWFSNRWGKPSPADAPPQYTEANLREAFHAGAKHLASALNHELAKTREHHNSPNVDANIMRIQGLKEVALLDAAQAAGLPLKEDLAGPWIDEDALRT